MNFEPVWQFCIEFYAVVVFKTGCEIPFHSAVVDHIVVYGLLTFNYVSHRHITVNGDVLNIPSYSVKNGDIIAVREKSKSLEVIAASLSGTSSSRYAWLEWEGTSLTGKFMQKPERDEIPENINEQLIVELYSK